MNALTVRSATDVWAAGSAPYPAEQLQPVVAVSHWNGTSWTQVPLPLSCHR